MNDYVLHLSKQIHIKALIDTKYTKSSNTCWYVMINETNSNYRYTKKN